MAIGPGTVLVVDDDEPNRDMLSRRLVRKGYRAGGLDGARLQGAAVGF